MIGSRTHWVSKSADAQVPYIVTAISAVYTVVSAHVDMEGCLYIPEKAMATHSNTLTWKIPWMDEPGGLQSMGSLRVGHD